MAGRAGDLLLVAGAVVPGRARLHSRRVSRQAWGASGACKAAGARSGRQGDAGTGLKAEHACWVRLLGPGEQQQLSPATPACGVAGTSHAPAVGPGFWVYCLGFREAWQAGARGGEPPWLGITQLYI